MELKAEQRIILGKKNKTIRQQGLIPAELYGRGFDNVSLSVSAKDFLNVFKEAGESSVVKLKVLNKGGSLEKEKEYNVLINDFQRSPLTNEISHIDFYSVRMDEKISAMVPLEFIGEAPVVKEKAGILIKSMQEVEVEALPADLPHHIEVDISGLLSVGASIFVKDLKIGKNAKFLVSEETVVVAIAEIEKEEEVVAPVSVEEIKVEREEKREKNKKEEQ